MKKIILKQLATGTLPVKVLRKKIIPTIVIVFACLLLVSRILFPYLDYYPFSWMTSTISRLGWPHENVTGWWFFSAAFIVLGIMMLPLIHYFHEWISKESKSYARLASTFLFLASVGLIIVGAIPNFKTDDNLFLLIHLIGALLSFGGLYMTAILVGMFVLIGAIHGRKRRETGIYLLLLVYGMFTMIIMLAVAPKTGGFSQYVHDPTTPILRAVPLWEWQTFLLAIVLIPLPVYFFFENT